jgi:conjugative transfer pilus assembly protein TraH
MKMGFKGVCIALLFCLDVNAGVESSMKDFLMSNSNANYSSGGAYSSQRRGYFATPSVYVRNQVVDIRPASMAMPTFRGGCGGIDMFSGSFSHINADQFIALLKAIPSNATGYAFQLALETISPSIADVMSQMEAIMRSMNNTNLNSCELGKAIINNGLSKFEAGSEMLCVRNQMEKGIATDIAQAKKNCTSGGQKTATIASAANQDTAIVDINYAWNAIDKFGVDREMKEFIQTLTGTIIVLKPNNDNSSATIKVYPSLAVDKQTIDALLYGGNMKKYLCDEQTKCLNINDATVVNITQNAAFHKRINNVLQSISTKMLARNEALTDDESAILSTTSFPVLAILRTYQKYHSGGVNTMISDSLSEIIAHDLLVSYLENSLAIVKKVSMQNN